jgi:hypothetical protein
MKKEMNESLNIKRRDLLKTFVASGISKSLIRTSPLVAGLLFARHADAAPTSLATKSVAVYVPGGGIHDFWAPTGSGASMTMGSMSAGYEPVKTDCNFLKNMSHQNGGHGQTPLILSPGYSGDSYDVFMGRHLGATMPFTYLNLGVHSNGHGVLTRDGNTNVPFQDNPFTAFKLIFGGASASTTPLSKIMDAHVDAANSIKTSLASYEVHRMNEHLDAIADTRRRLDNASGAVCSSQPTDVTFPLTHETFTRQAHLQADIIVAALKCNFTSSCSIAFGNHQSEFRIPELNYQGQYHQSIHGGSDGQPNYPYYVEMRNHLGSLTAYLINKLRTEGLLDSTMLVEVTDMGHGDLHGQGDVPMLMAGAAGAINRGVTTAGSGYSQHDMLHTAALACGATLPYGKEIPGVIL